MQFFFLLFFFFPPGWLASFFSRHVLFICRLSTEFKTTPSFRLCRVFEDGWDYLAWFSSPASSWQVRPGTLPLEGLWGVVIPVQARCPAAAVVCYHKQSQVSVRPAQWLPVAHPDATHLSLLSIWNVQRDQFWFYQLSFNFTCDFFFVVNYSRIMQSSIFISRETNLCFLFIGAPSFCRRRCCVNSSL